MSGDPISFGHLNIIDRALKTFDHVLVGIGINPKKKYTFKLEERESLTKRVLQPYGERVTVKSYSGLLADFAYENQINTIIRGARNTADFDFERLLADINQGFRMGLETYLMVADPKLSHISSSAVKELQEHQAKNIKEYVPLIVKEALEMRISGQYRIGVTGGIGSGKSFISNSLKHTSETMIHTLSNNSIKVHVIDMDEAGRYILKESKEDIHQHIRLKVADRFGQNLLKEDKIDVAQLLKLLFDDAETSLSRHEFEEIMAEPTMHIVRRQLKELKGVVLINSALFVEADICDIVNNNFIFVSCSEETRISRLKKRGYSDFQIKNRLHTQLSPDTKLEAIKGLIHKESCGSVIEFENNDNNDSDIRGLYETIKKIYEAKKYEIFD
jgi:pantetheine-phosphate adenylyltransferase